MADDKFTKINKIIDYWLKGANDDFRTAKILFAPKRYQHCLFFCHLCLEKIIKTLVVRKTKQQAPYGHNLLRLSELSGIRFSQEQLDLLAEITSFNIAARYNDFKRTFYKKATGEYTQGYLEKVKRLYQWLKRELSINI